MGPGMLRVPAATWALVVWAVACSAGCHSPLARSIPEEPLRLDTDIELITGLSVPEVRGPDGCGAQALATVLAHVDPGLDAATVADELPWHDFGATPVDLLLVARDRGCRAKIAHGSIELLARNVEAGRPILVMIDAAYEIRTLTSRLAFPRVMHWAVVSGMASDGSRVLLAAPHARHHVVDRDDFRRRWSRSANCMIILSRDSDATP